MSVTEHELEHIVREVLRRLREHEITRQIREESAQNKEQPGTLILTEQVVTLATLKDRLTGAKRVIVAHGTIITPAAADELKARVIRLEFETNTKNTLGQRKSLLLAVTTNHNPKALVKRLTASGIDVEQLTATNWKDTVTRMTQKIKHGETKGVILTDRPAAAACHANRDSAIRAAMASDLRSVKDATDSLDANLLLVDPAAHSLNTLENLLREYARANQREMPL